MEQLPLVNLTLLLFSTVSNCHSSPIWTYVNLFCLSQFNEYFYIFIFILFLVFLPCLMFMRVNLFLLYIFWDLSGSLGFFDFEYIIGLF